MVPDKIAGITPKNVSKLRLKWAFAAPSARRVRSHPLLAGGALFMGTEDGTVYALDQETGCVRWSYLADAEVRTGIALRKINAAEGEKFQIYFGDLLGRVYALDASSGDLLWRVRADDHPGTTITGTPTVYRDVVYAPVSSLEVVFASMDSYNCCVFRGSVVAYDAATGDELWRTFTVTETRIAQGKNAAGAQNFGPSGAPIWNSPAIDVKRQVLYVGSGENYSSPPTDTSDAIIAMKLDTGERVWHYQATPHDAWNTACSGRSKGANCPSEDGPDFDFGAGMVLTEAGDRSLVLGAQKSGAVHAIDADSGEHQWSTRLGRGGLHGGVHFGIAVSEERAYIPISDANDFGEHESPARPGLYALAVRTGKTLWQSPLEDACLGRELCDVGIGGAITATNSLVFAGALDGWLRIHDAGTGAVLKRIDTTQEVATISGELASGGSMDGASAPLPFAGRLYVTSGYNFAGHMPGNVLLVYEVAAED